MGNINPEIIAFQKAEVGEEVRSAIISLAQKLNAIVEQVVIDTDRNILVGYKTINPSDYDNLLENVDVAAVFVGDTGQWSDVPSNNEFVIINCKCSANYNLQIAFGLLSKSSLYWRIVKRDPREVFVDWQTDDTPTDITLSVSGAAADAAMVGLALSNRVNNMNAYIDNTLTVGMDFAGANKGLSSIRMGDNNVASQTCSVAMGNGTNAESANQVAEGKYNIKDTEGKYAHIVGNGLRDGSRSNAATLDWYGNAWFAGGVELNDTVTGTRYRITVANGQLQLTALT